MKKLVLFLLIIMTTMGCSLLNRKKKREARAIMAMAAAMRKQSTITGVGPFVLNKTDVTFLQALQDSLEPGFVIPVLDVVSKKQVEDSSYFARSIDQVDTTTFVLDSVYTFTSFIDSVDIPFTDSTFLADSVSLIDSTNAPDVQPIVFSKHITEFVNYYSFDESASKSSSTCSEARVFHIDSLEVDGIPMKNIYLQFFKGKLYSFRCNADQTFQKYLKAKYGQPVSNSVSTQVPHRDGRTVKLQETNMYWYNKTYNAHLTWSALDGVDEKGTFTIVDNALSAEWEDCHTGKLSKE